MIRDEDEAIRRILERVGDTSALAVGPGHDCAVLDVPEGRVVVTTDVLVDGVHFRLEACGARAAARKALLVNLSDLAAAAALPLGCEVGVVLPRGAPPGLLDELAEGFGEAADRYGCPIAGGDTNVADGPLVLAVTAFGRPGEHGVVTRSGAKPGDRLSVTGPLGGSLEGRHLDFVPRLREAQVLQRLGIPHAMMDLSDGLSRDLPRLARASGVGALVRTADVPVHADAAGALDRALHDGEDFELLLAHAALDPTQVRALEAEDVRLREIGEIVDAAAGITIVGPEGRHSLEPRGWDHLLMDDVWTVEAEDPEASRRLGRALGAEASRVTEHGLLVALHGSLGAGKTVFVQGVGRGLGIPTATPVVSPTFTIARSYQAGRASGVVLHHLDAYRLGDEDELENAGFEDMCGSGRFTFVEWAERVERALPRDRLEVVIEVLPPRVPTAEGDAPVAPRRFLIRATGARAKAVLDAWRRRYEGGEAR